jgi:hypothetical protein
LDGFFLLLQQNSVNGFIFQAISNLAGNTLRAQATMNGGTQIGDPSNLTARIELTRWFGVSVIYSLYLAQMVTSGTDNDRGFGIMPFPSNPTHWVCSGTLRISSEFTSLDLTSIILFIVGAAIVILTSYMMQPTLFYISSRNLKTAKSQSSWKKVIRESLIGYELHSLLQLHRIAIQSTYGYCFRDTIGEVPVDRLKNAAPIYGITYENDDYELRGLVPTVEDGEDGQNPSSSPEHAIVSSSTKVLLATMLRSQEERVENYDVKVIL